MGITHPTCARLHLCNIHPTDANLTVLAVRACPAGPLRVQGSIGVYTCIYFRKRVRTRPLLTPGHANASGPEIPSSADGSRAGLLHSVVPKMLAAI